MTDRDRMTDEGWANRQARNRARERARHKTAMDFHGAYLRHYHRALADGQERTTAKATAYRAVCAVHPRRYREYYAAELAVESIVDLPMGFRPVYPCGTDQGWKRHVRHGEDPSECPTCLAWYEETFARICRTCDRPFASRRPKTFCDARCRRLWYRCLRYWEDPMKHVAYQATQAIKSDNPADRRRGRQQLAEYRRTGTVTRRRYTKASDGPRGAMALNLAAEIGIDLDATIARLRSAPK